jgi:predicted unusual protein kinase regulating ubiquinone biosynthesis (AarF/ABC1/UbiB family)
LDFLHEANNINRLAYFIRREKIKKVSVPEVLSPTTKKILIMEFINGYHID